jgi:hypothetical protein
MNALADCEFPDFCGNQFTQKLDALGRFGLKKLPRFGA